MPQDNTQAPPVKLPHFSFYAGDHMSEMSGLFIDERGAYISLICYQWENGSIPTGDLRRLAAICLAPNRPDFEAVWLAVAHLFPGGRNVRLEAQRTKALKAYSNKCRGAVAARAAKASKFRAL